MSFYSFLNPCALCHFIFWVLLYFYIPTLVNQIQFLLITTKNPQCTAPPPKKVPKLTISKKKKIQIAQWLMFFLYEHKDLCSHNYALCRTSAQCVLEAPMLGHRPATPRNSLTNQVNPMMSSAFSKRLCLKTMRRKVIEKNISGQPLLSTRVQQARVCVPCPLSHTIEMEDVTEYLQRKGCFNSELVLLRYLDQV